MAVAAAYSEGTAGNSALGLLGGSIAGIANVDSQYFQIGAYVQHVPTGLFVYGAYGHQEMDFGNNDPLGDGDQGEDINHSTDNWYLKPGIRQRWTPLGHTVLYGEYQRLNDGESIFIQDAINNGSRNQLQVYGAGIVQEIDAAAMSVWLTYRHFEGEIDRESGNFDVDDFDLVKFGALINF